MIVKKRKCDVELDFTQLTDHILDRKPRMDVYFGVKEMGEVFDAFIVDKDHPNGDEVHVITTNGFILIFNERTERFITILHARPGQLRRYYLNLEEEVPYEIEEMGDLNQELNEELNLNYK